MVRIDVLPDGRLVLPLALRRSLGVEKGGQIVAELADGAVRLTTPDASLDRARSLFRAHVPAGSDIAGEVITERRAEAAGESGAADDDDRPH